MPPSRAITPAESPPHSGSDVAELSRSIRGPASAGGGSAAPRHGSGSSTHVAFVGHDAGHKQIFPALESGPPTMPRPISVVSASAAAHPHLGCAACPHEWGGHDPIGVRFCATTITAGLNRGCVCVNDVALFAPGGEQRR